MRIGIYTGRHAGSGGGIGVYVRSYIRRVIELVENNSLEAEEFVFYGAREILSDEFLDELFCSSVLFRISHSVFSQRADRVFSKLSNGSSYKVIFRRLPKCFNYKTAIITDQFLLPYMVRRDKIDFLHSLANIGPVFLKQPQVITVHDLFQAWPKEENKTKAKAELKRIFFRKIFKKQFSLSPSPQVVVDAESTGKEIEKRYGLDKKHISTISLGVDEVFANCDPKSFNSSEWLKEKELKEPYVLHIASSNPRKNFINSCLAWKKLAEHSADTPSLLLLASDEGVKKLLRSLKLDKDLLKRIYVLNPLEREEIPKLFYSASVLLFASHAEGFGFPALEALSLGTAVVSAELEYLRQEELSKELVFTCDPSSIESISEALVSGLSVAGKKQGQAVRSMSQAVSETLELYKAYY